MTSHEADVQRERMAEMWESVAPGWGRQADRIQQMGLAVSAWMVEHLELVPGQRVLDLAAGPGDTGFLAAELVKPGGTLICSDASDAMLEVARERAAQQGISNVEFKRLDLEWIDLPTASVDAILCRWAVMLLVDPASALSECRRVLRPGGRLAMAVWDEAQANPWAAVLQGMLLDLGFIEPPQPGAAGMFALGAPGRLEEMLRDAGFVDVVADLVPIMRDYEGIEDLVAEAADVSPGLSGVWSKLSAAQRQEVVDDLTARTESFRDGERHLRLPGSSRVALAQA